MMNGLLGSQLLPAGWSYSLRADDSRIEQAIWAGGSCPSLAAHFHDEMQMTVVLAGRREFLMQHGIVAVNAGETLIIPAGMPHEPLGVEAKDALSLNLYLACSEGFAQRQPAVVPTPAWLHLNSAVDQSMLTNWTMDVLMRPQQTETERDADYLIRSLMRCELAINRVAERHGMTREGFTRRFRRAVGMTPHAYRLTHRLNRARSLLARGVRAAEAAADAGFSDQSHLGRNFRRSFGATPDSYRRSLHD
jgi:AraC-like DNA-binding protein